MKIVPNFERKELWEFAESCRDCKNYECKLESCMEVHCPYIKRKIRSNSIITRDLVETFLVDNPYIPFAHRVINMLAKYKGNKLFYNKAHKAAFEAAMNEINDDDYDQYRLRICFDHPPGYLRTLRTFLTRVSVYVGGNRTARQSARFICQRNL